MRLGDKVRTNRMFRARIYAQGFTLAAMLGGSVYYKKQRDEEKEVDVRKAAVKAKEKQSAWIRELEIRDKEDKEVRRFFLLREIERGKLMLRGDKATKEQ